MTTATGFQYPVASDSGIASAHTINYRKGNRFTCTWADPSIGYNECQAERLRQIYCKDRVLFTLRVPQGFKALRGCWRKRVHPKPLRLKFIPIHVERDDPRRSPRCNLSIHRPR